MIICATIAIKEKDSKMQANSKQLADVMSSPKILTG